jgi:hypothetical protein
MMPVEYELVSVDSIPNSLPLLVDILCENHCFRGAIGVRNDTPPAVGDSVNIPIPPNEPGKALGNIVFRRTA